MKLKFIEATNKENGGFNWGKFFLLQMTAEEWQYKSQLKCEEPDIQAVQDKYPLLHLIGYSKDNIFVFDLQTREGAAFVPRKTTRAKLDLDQKRIWTCPLFEPFLQWLYEQDCADIDKLPSIVELVAPSELRGYRRRGKHV